MTKQPRVLAITACPAGIAHTYMAAEKLTEAAGEAGVDIRVETHGSIGVENAFTDAEVQAADAVIIAADKTIDLERFEGKPLTKVAVADAIRRPKELIDAAPTAPVYQPRSGRGGSAANGSGDGASAAAAGVGKSGFGRELYLALMNGVSHMVPVVVTGGLLIAIALSVGGSPTEKGLVIPEGTFWFNISQLGALAFKFMVPVTAGYIAMGIADRPGLAPGLITGAIAADGTLYHSQVGTGFLGGIVAGLLSGYIAKAIRKIPVHRYIAPIWPIIIIPVFTTLIVGLLFIYVIGAPISDLFEHLQNYLAHMSGGSVLLLGAIMGAMIAFDMGGPFNKTAFAFSGGLIAAGNAAPMGMIAAAIAVPPLGVGLASVLRRKWFTKPEQDAGIAALFMGFFGITEGAIPFATARPLQIIPANVIGGAVAGALVGQFGVHDNVMHGGPIVAVLGAVDGVAWYFIALAIGVAVTTTLSIVLIGLSRRKERAQAVGAGAAGAAPAAGVAGASGDRTEPAEDLLVEPHVLLDVPLESRESAIRALAERCQQSGRIADIDAVVDAALAREQ